VANSGHNIPDQAPDAVVAAVRSVLEQSKRGFPQSEGK
jgi:hypothetical protein